MDANDAKVLWTTALTRQGTTPDAEANESPLAILSRMARNIETIADRLARLEDK